MAGALLGAALAGCGEREPAPPGEAPAASAERTADGAGAVVLTPAFAAGESATYQFEETSVKTQTTSQYSFLREASELRVFDLETLAVDDEGVATLRLTMRRVGSVLADNGTVTYRYDSMTPPAESAEPLAAPTRAREALAGLVAEMRVGPDGRVGDLRANLTVEQVAAIPEGLRPLLSENWTRSVIESLFRPYGELTRVELDGAATREAPAPETLAETGTLVEEVAAESAGEETARLSSRAALVVGGEPRPETYQQQMVVEWSRGAGRVERLARREQASVERTIAGLDGVETLDRRFLLARVNPTPENDDNAGSGAGGMRP